jgi:hypothetical protein
VSEDVEDWRAFRKVMRKAEYAHELETENEYLRMARDILRDALREAQARLGEWERGERG